MKKTNILCLVALLFGYSMAANNPSNKIKVYDNLLELNSTQTPKRLNQVDETVANENVSDVKVQVTILEDNQTRDIRFVAALDSLDYSEVGFEITINKSESESKTITKSLEIAYTGIVIDNEVYSTKEIFGAEYNYMIAYEISDVPSYSYDYKYSAVAYVVNNENKVVSTNAKNITVGDLAFEDMISHATKFNLTEANGYNGNWMTIGWNENEINISNANFDFKKNVYYRFTLNDGTVLYFDKGNETCHQNGATDNIFGLNCQFDNLNTSEKFKKIEVILNDNGSLYYGYVDYVNLETLENINIDENYVITFDELENANSYTVRIYNDNYTNEATEVKSGDKLSVTTLENGTYNIEITAIGKFGYSNSVTTVENAFTIEQTQEILNAPVGAYTFDFDRLGRGVAWETPVKITWSDDKYAATNDNSISEFGFYINGAKQSNIGSTGGFENKYYDTYYGIFYSSGAFYDTTATTTYSLRFYITTNSGQVYYVNHNFFVKEIEGSADLNFIQEGTDEYATIANAKLIYFLDNEIDETKAIDKSNMTAKAIYSDGTEKDTSANLAIDNVSDYRKTRWESQFEDDVTLYIDLGDTYKLNKISFLWEGAYTKDFDILVSTDDLEYNVYASIKNATFYDGQYTSSLKTSGNEMEARYVKIHCKTRATQWGNSIYDILFFEA